MNIFRRSSHNPKCSGKGIFGCKCGDLFSGRKKAEQGISDAGNQAYNQSKQTGSEAAQYEGSFDIGKLLNQLFQYQMGMGQAPQGYQNSQQQFLNQNGEVGQNYYNQILNESRDPYANFESSFRPQLQQAQDSINTYYQKRGLLNSGLAIEGMGRAGVDLAIKESQARMQARQQSMGEVSDFLNYTGDQQQKNIGNLTGLYNTQQQAGLNSMSRQGNAAFQNADYQSYGSRARLGDVYGRTAALYALPGQVISGGQKAATGGAPVPG